MENILSNNFLSMSTILQYPHQIKKNLMLNEANGAETTQISSMLPHDIIKLIFYVIIWTGMALSSPI